MGGRCRSATGQRDCQWVTSSAVASSCAVPSQSLSAAALKARWCASPRHPRSGTVRECRRGIQECPQAPRNARVGKEAQGSGVVVRPQGPKVPTRVPGSDRETFAAQRIRRQRRERNALRIALRACHAAGSGECGTRAPCELVPPVHATAVVGERGRNRAPGHDGHQNDASGRPVRPRETVRRVRGPPKSGLEPAIAAGWRRRLRDNRRGVAPASSGRESWRPRSGPWGRTRP